MIDFEKLPKIENLLDKGIYAISVASAVPSNKRIVILVGDMKESAPWSFSAYYNNGEWWTAITKQKFEVNESCLWMEHPFSYIEE